MLPPARAPITLTRLKPLMRGDTGLNSRKFSLLLAGQRLTKHRNGAMQRYHPFLVSVLPNVQSSPRWSLASTHNATHSQLVSIPRNDRGTGTNRIYPLTTLRLKAATCQRGIFRGARNPLTRYHIEHIQGPCTTQTTLTTTLTTLLVLASGVEDVVVVRESIFPLIHTRWLELDGQIGRSNRTTCPRHTWCVKDRTGNTIPSPPRACTR
jgi:hypothetical protein